jgi:hypothetical protein
VETPLKIFPIKGKAFAGFFREREISNNTWEVEGSDLWCRKIYRQGGDTQELIVSCEQDAKQINEQPNSTL